MANRKISDLTSLTAPATGDLLPIVDISEAAAADKNKKITFGELLASAPAGTTAAPSFSFDGDPNTGIFNPAADTLAFAGGGTEIARIDSSSRLLVGTSTANTSGAKLQTSDGLTFPATAVASADPNTLDDYEEGTFTPTIIGLTTAGTATYGGQFGTYTKIGRAVTYTIYLIYSAGTGTGNLAIAGLPFTASSFFSAAFSLVHNVTLPALNVIGGYTDSGQNRILIVAQSVGGGGFSSVAYDSAGETILSGTYFTT